MKKVTNKNLQDAKRAKNDEFYTRYEDIEKEITHYTEYLNGKWIYSPCDDYDGTTETATMLDGNGDFRSE